MCPDRQGGFTLFELLIAMTLTAVIGVVMFKTWDMVVSSSLSAKELVSLREKERTVFNIMDNDMAAIHMPDEDASLQPALSRRAIEPSAAYYKLTGRQKDKNRDRNTSVLVSFSSGSSLKAEGAPTGFPVCVEYILRTSNTGIKKLVRRERDFCGVNGDYPWRETTLMDNLDEAYMELEMRDGSRLDSWNQKDLLAQPVAICFSWRKKGAQKADEILFPFPERRLEIGWEKKNQ